MEPSSHPWYVVHTRPQKEMLVASLLQERLAAVPFLPEVLQKGRRSMVLRPLFPAYLFVQVDLAQHLPSAIHTLPGVRRLLAGPDGPLSVDPVLVAALRQECQRLNAAGGLFATDLQPGEPVRLVSGPLAGLEAVFVQPLPPGDRAAVLLHFLNRQNQVTVALADLERVREIERPPRQRSSRGHGRPIRARNHQDTKT